jgi:hypothetical protein
LFIVKINRLLSIKKQVDAFISNLCLHIDGNPSHHGPANRDPHSPAVNSQSIQKSSVVNKKPQRYFY